MAPRRSKVQPTGQPAPVQPATVQRAPAQRALAQHASTPLNSDYLTLDEYDKAPDSDEDLGQSFEAACAQDLIARIRRIVTSIQLSTQHRDAFILWIMAGNKSGVFVLEGKPVQIQPRGLLQDVPTRWESTHQMIERFLEMRLAIDTFLSRPGSDLAYLALTKKDRDLLQDLEAVL